MTLSKLTLGMYACSNNRKLADTASLAISQQQEIDQLQAQNGAAIEDIKHALTVNGGCPICKHWNKAESQLPWCKIAKVSSQANCFEWRGVSGTYHNPTDVEALAKVREGYVALPTIKRGKTLYWVWADKIVRFMYKRIYVGSMIDGKFRIMCEMKLLEDVVINKHLICKGDKRYFYADDLDIRDIFTTREGAEQALAAIDKAGGGEK